MKKLFTIILLIAARLALGQGFEGTVKWSMKMDITDPKLKAEMEQAQQKMNDPATQAKMKEMQAQMNDPQMKAMMDANPAMKAQMENAMKMQQGGGGMGSMMPKGMIIKVKGDNSLAKMDGGMMDGMEVLHMKGKPSVRLDRQNKTWSTMSSPPAESGNATPPKITKTSETATILGYKCTKYLVETTERGKPITQSLWYTIDIKDYDFKSMARQRMGQGGQQMFYEQIDGVPLKVEMASPEGNMVMEVTELKRESISAADVSIPPDFKEVKGRM